MSELESGEIFRLRADEWLAFMDALNREPRFLPRLAALLNEQDPFDNA